MSSPAPVFWTSFPKMALKYPVDFPMDRKMNLANSGMSARIFVTVLAALFPATVPALWPKRITGDYAVTRRFLHRQETP
jgi:hypothetical protein